MSDDQAADHVADARITGPLVVGPVADQRPADRASESRVSAWLSAPTRSPLRWVTRPDPDAADR